MELHYTDYLITQNGVDLTIDSAIKIQKYENKVSRLVFKVEDWLKESARLYLAILNPETERYHYEPLIPGDDYYYYIVGTSLSYYPGKQTLLLIGVSPYFILEDDITLDPSATVYVSREFKRLVVIDNFISDISKDVTMPSLEYLLDDFMTMHENVITIGVQTAEDLVKCDEDLAKCEEAVAQCTDLVEQCITHVTSCETHEAQTAENLERDTQVRQECAEILSNARQILEECNGVLGECNGVLDSCNSAMNSCTQAESNCRSARSQANSALAQCQSVLTSINNLRRTMNNEYDSHMNAMREAYEEYMANIQGGGGEP